MILSISGTLEKVHSTVMGYFEKLLGAFGETIEARHIKTGLHRAVKLLAVSGLTLRERLEIVEEINILKDLVNYIQ